MPARSLPCFALALALALLSGCASPPSPAPAAPAAHDEPPEPPASAKAGDKAAPSADKPEAPPPPSGVKVEGNTLALPSAITFEQASDKLTRDSDPALDSVKRYLDEKAYISLLRVEGHVQGGVPAQDQDLSERRALAVARALVARGVDCKRLIVVGFGNTKPIGPGSAARIELVNAGLRGKPIGGMPVEGGGKVAGEVCR